MRREPHITPLATAIALRSTTSWLRWLCFRHDWIEIARHDDLVSERCAHCEKLRRWHLPIEMGEP